MIQPRVLKGFRDFLPDLEARKKSIVRTLEEVFTSFGYLPIDTPVLEYAEILLGKSGGETEKQVYRFTDHGGRDVALRFDLTVPFARFMAQHMAELYLPFRRYHIAKVFRGENTQRGRYREFMQCDFDIVGPDSTSADLEVLLIMQKALASLGMERFTIHLSHRGVLQDFLARLEVAEPVEVLRTVDKVRKIGREKVREMLAQLSDEERAGRILDFIAPGSEPEEALARMEEGVGADNPHLARLKEIWAVIGELGLAGFFTIDPSITRGLDYYTGVVFETFLSDLPDIGSVCSGGRYDNLVGLYSAQSMSGVGASIGLDRLMAAMQELGMLEAIPTMAPEVLVVCMEERFLAHYHGVAAALRARGIRTEVYPQARKLGQQFSYAEKKGIPFALIMGEDEIAAGTMALKDLVARTQTVVRGLEEVVHAVEHRREGVHPS